MNLGKMGLVEGGTIVRTDIGSTSAAFGPSGRHSRHRLVIQHTGRLFRPQRSYCRTLASTRGKNSRRLVLPQNVPVDWLAVRPDFPIPQSAKGNTTWQG